MIGGLLITLGVSALGWFKIVLPAGRLLQLSAELDGLRVEEPQIADGAAK
jgi:hypothetical protein